MLSANMPNSFKNIKSKKSNVNNFDFSNLTGNNKKTNKNSAFKQLFLKVNSEKVSQNELPQKISIDKLLKLVSENKIEVYINDKNDMIDVTKFFKSKDFLSNFIDNKSDNAPTQMFSIKSFNNNQSTNKLLSVNNLQPGKTNVNTRFLEINFINNENTSATSKNQNKDKSENKKEITPNIVLLNNIEMSQNETIKTQKLAKSKTNNSEKKNIKQETPVKRHVSSEKPILAKNISNNSNPKIEKNTSQGKQYIVKNIFPKNRVFFEKDLNLSEISKNEILASKKISDNPKNKVTGKQFQQDVQEISNNKVVIPEGKKFIPNLRPVKNIKSVALNKLSNGITEDKIITQKNIKSPNDSINIKNSNPNITDKISRINTINKIQVNEKMENEKVLHLSENKKQIVQNSHKLSKSIPDKNVVQDKTQVQKNIEQIISSDKSPKKSQSENKIYMKDIIKNQRINKANPKVNNQTESKIETSTKNNQNNHSLNNNRLGFADFQGKTTQSKQVVFTRQSEFSKNIKPSQENIKPEINNTIQSNANLKDKSRTGNSENFSKNISIQNAVQGNTQLSKDIEQDISFDKSPKNSQSENKISMNDIIKNQRINKANPKVSKQSENKIETSVKNPQNKLSSNDKRNTQEIPSQGKQAVFTRQSKNNTSTNAIYESIKPVKPEVNDTIQSNTHLKNKPLLNLSLNNNRTKQTTNQEKPSQSKQAVFTRQSELSKNIKSSQENIKPVINNSIQSNAPLKDKSRTGNSENFSKNIPVQNSVQGNTQRSQNIEPDISFDKSPKNSQSENKISMNDIIKNQRINKANPKVSKQSENKIETSVKNSQSNLSSNDKRNTQEISSQGKQAVFTKQSEIDSKLINEKIEFGENAHSVKSISQAKSLNQNNNANQQIFVNNSKQSQEMQGVSIQKESVKSNRFIQDKESSGLKLNNISNNNESLSRFNINNDKPVLGERLQAQESSKNTILNNIKKPLQKADVQMNQNAFNENALKNSVLSEGSISNQKVVGLKVKKDVKVKKTDNSKNEIKNDKEFFVNTLNEVKIEKTGLSDNIDLRKSSALSMNNNPVNDRQTVVQTNKKQAIFKSEINVSKNDVSKVNKPLAKKDDLDLSRVRFNRYNEGLNSSDKNQISLDRANISNQEIFSVKDSYISRSQEKNSLTMQDFNKKTEKNYNADDINESNKAGENFSTNSYSVDRKENSSAFFNEISRVAHTMQNSIVKDEKGEKMFNTDRNENLSNRQERDTNTHSKPEDMFKNHFNQDKPFTLKVKNEDGKFEYREVVIDKKDLSDKLKEESTVLQDESLKQKPNINESKYTENNQKSISIKNSETKNDANQNQGQNEGFNNLNQSFNNRTAETGTGFSQRSSSIDFDYLYQQVMNKASELNKSQKYEIKTMFEVVTSSLGKLNTSIEKIGDSLVIRFKAESKEKEEILKDNIQSLSTGLKQFGFNQIEISIDLDAHSNEGFKHTQQETSKQNSSKNNEETSKQKESDFSQKRNFGYNTFEYTA